ncbi:MAG: hypothetical protein SVV80_00540 [Planctomycetota bacterium]|nr:hypothetical protein [Planctomycetota bacterium]
MRWTPPENQVYRTRHVFMNVLQYRDGVGVRTAGNDDESRFGFYHQRLLACGIAACYEDVGPNLGETFC